MLTLLYAAYRQIPFGDDAYVPEAERVARLADLAADEFRQARGAVPAVVEAESYLCSTVLNISSMDALYSNPVLTREIGRRTGLKPPSGVLAYECASWAYILRRLQSSMKATRILIFVADMDAKGFSFWGTNRIWGHSGFGLSTLVFDYVPDEQPCVWTSSSEARSPVLDFARGVKVLASNFPGDRISLPYFPPAQFQSIDRICTGLALAPNLHAGFGHCFGSDPWIGLLSACRGDAAQRDAHWICASFALSGYYGLARVRLHPDAQLHLSHASAAPPQAVLPEPSIA